MDIIYDRSKDISDRLRSKSNYVIDGGVTEHIFNAAKAYGVSTEIKKNHGKNVLSGSFIKRCLAGKQMIIKDVERIYGFNGADRSKADYGQASG